MQGQSHEWARIFFMHQEKALLKIHSKENTNRYVEEGQQGAESTQLAELRRSRMVPRQNVTKNYRYVSYPKNIFLDILLA